MNAYDIHLHSSRTKETANPTKIPPHANHLWLNYGIYLHMKITAHKIIQNSRQMPIIHLFTTTSTYNHTYNTHFLKKTFIISFIKHPEQINHILHHHVRLMETHGKHPIPYLDGPCYGGTLGSRTSPYARTPTNYSKTSLISSTI